MRDDLISELRQLPRGKSRQAFPWIVGAFILGALGGAMATPLLRTEDHPGLFPEMVASVALHQKINPLGLWEDILSDVGKPYDKFSVEDTNKALRSLGKRMTLPPQRFNPDQKLLY